MHFGTTVLRIDSWEKGQAVEVKDLMNAVSFFAAAGGTSFEEPLVRAAEFIEKSKSFKDADVIMITDGMANVGDEWRKDFLTKKSALSFKVYSILINSSNVVSELAARYSDEVVQLGKVLENDAAMHQIFSRI
jgi:uncharacterized protein with von Willebrand factor type A (vWA) domain